MHATMLTTTPSIHIGSLRRWQPSQWWRTCANKGSAPGTRWMLDPTSVAQPRGCSRSRQRAEDGRRSGGDPRGRRQRDPGVSLTLTPALSRLSVILSPLRSPDVQALQLSLGEEPMWMSAAQYRTSTETRKRAHVLAGLRRPALSRGHSPGRPHRRVPRCPLRTRRPDRAASPGGTPGTRAGDRKRPPLDHLHLPLSIQQYVSSDGALILSVSFPVEDRPEGLDEKLRVAFERRRALRVTPTPPNRSRWFSVPTPSRGRTGSPPGPLGHRRLALQRLDSASTSTTGSRLRLPARARRHPGVRCGRSLPPHRPPARPSRQDGRGLQPRP